MYRCESKHDANGQEVKTYCLTYGFLEGKQLLYRNLLLEGEGPCRRKCALTLGKAAGECTLSRIYSIHSTLLARDEGACFFILGVLEVVGGHVHCIY